MKTLSKEQIQFIDHYLKNSGIDFIDVRFEMIDHVASEIEARIKNGDNRTFYSIFKDYMAENKSKLLKNNSKYHWIADRRILNSILKKSFSLKGLIIFITIFLSFNVLELFLRKDHLVSVIQHGPTAIMLIILIIYSAVIKTKKERYSALERVGLYYYIVSELITTFFSPLFSPKGYVTNNLILMKMSTSFLLFILVILTLCALEFKKDYQLKYGTTN